MVEGKDKHNGSAQEKLDRNRQTFEQKNGPVPSWRRALTTRLFYAWDAISFTTMAAEPVSIHFVCGETRRPAGNCFATPVLVGRDVTAAIVVNAMRETAVLELAASTRPKELKLL